jgi:PAS domain S-box-containing protein
MERRQLQHSRLARPGRRQNDRRPPAAEHRRILLVGPDEAWRLLNAYVFEEAGFVVYAAADQQQAVAFTNRLLPDVVVVGMDIPHMLVLAERSGRSSISDIPVVVLTSSLESADARRARAAGAVTLLAHPADTDALIDEVSALVAAAPRAHRALKRRLLDLQELAQYYKPDADGQALFRRLIDRLQVAIFALDERGHCIAASKGATALTGYSQPHLLRSSVFEKGFAGGRISNERWQGFLAHGHYEGTTTITNRDGQDVTVHAAAVAEIMPGFHVAAVAAV